MATRGFRPRPLDQKKTLPIVRDLSELDSTEGLVSRDVTNGNTEADKDSDKAVKRPEKKAKEIPVPEVRAVPTYYKDYLPVYRPPLTYVRDRGSTGSIPREVSQKHKEDVWEYDLSVEDEEWLEKFNAGLYKLEASKLELMLATLEHQCVAAAEAGSSVGGGGPERTSQHVSTSVDHFTKAKALQALREAIPAREPIYEGVHHYWVSRRRKLGRPLVRRLQPPTPASDSNPFNVFRQREKANRPQTRRRRENSEESFEKLRTMRLDLSLALDLMKQLVAREKLKRCILNLELDEQQLLMMMRHAPRAEFEDAEQRAMASARSRGEKPAFQPELVRALAEQQSCAAQDGVSVGRTVLNRLHFPHELGIAGTPWLLEPIQDSMPYSADVPLTALPPSCGSLLEGKRGRGRIGRGGRLILDRCQPFTQLPWEDDEPQATGPSSAPAERQPSGASPSRAATGTASAGATAAEAEPLLEETGALDWPPNSINPLSTASPAVHTLLANPAAFASVRVSLEIPLQNGPAKGIQ